MPLPKYAARRDKNETDIVKALRDVPGLSVVPLSAKDVPDLLIGYQDKNFLIELKNKKGLNKLQEGQAEFLENWKGQVAVAHSLEDILDILGITH